MLTLVYQYQLPFLKTGYHYRCDVRDNPTDLGLWCSGVTFQLPQNASFNTSLQTVVLLVVVCAAATAGGDVCPGSSRVPTWSYAAVRKSSGKWLWSLGLALTVTNGRPPVATSLKPTFVWVVQPWMIVPLHCAVSRSQLCRLDRGWGRGADSASQMLYKYELNGPSHPQALDHCW